MRIVVKHGKWTARGSGGVTVPGGIQEMALCGTWCHGPQWGNQLEVGLDGWT